MFGKNLTCARKFFALLGVALLTALATTACTDETPTLNPNGTAVEKATEYFKDVGTLQLPNQPYRVHAYRLKPKGEYAQFLYILEDMQGTVVAGVPASEEQPNGKSRKAVGVTTQLAAPGTAASAQTPAARPAPGSIEIATKLTCASIEQCERKLKAMRETN